jgi:hypothetical protein
MTSQKVKHLGAHICTEPLRANLCASANFPLFFFQVGRHVVSHMVRNKCKSAETGGMLLETMWQGLYHMEQTI